MGFPCKRFKVWKIHKHNWTYMSSIIFYLPVQNTILKQTSLYLRQTSQPTGASCSVFLQLLLLITTVRYAASRRRSGGSTWEISLRFSCVQCVPACTHRKHSTRTTNSAGYWRHRPGWVLRTVATSRSPLWFGQKMLLKIWSGTSRGL